MAAELTPVPGILRAGSSVGDAMIDPSIPSLTKAGVDTGAALFSPRVMLGSLGAGYTAAAADQLGLLPSDAHAQGLNRAQRREQEIKRQDDERRAKIDGEAAERASKLKTQEQDAESARALAAEAKRGERDKFNRQVETAETVRDRELARDKRFADTPVGQVYEKTAGVTPFLAAGALGALTRAPMKSSNFSNYALPAGLGAIEGGIAANVPLGTDAYFLPPALNPKREAYEAYARELPPDHPRRQEWMDYASRLPQENPVRSNSSKEFYDPMKLAERTGAGVAEGITGGVAGAKAVDLLYKAAGKAGTAIAGAPGAALDFVRGSRPAAPATTSATAADIPFEANALSRAPIAGPASFAPNQPASGVQNALAGPAQPQRQLPAPVASPNQSASPSPDRPSWAGDPPEGVRLKRGELWDTNAAQPRKAGRYAPVRYSAPKPTKDE